MTLPEIKEPLMPFNSKSESSKNIGETLRECIWQGVEDKRVTCGVLDCAKVLRSDPDNVMICILTEAESENISIHIQHTLIEAFCWENDIRILKVKNQQAVGEILHGRKGSGIAEKNSKVVAVTETDTSCVMIKYSNLEISTEDFTLINYHDTVMMSNQFPKPVIHLPS